MYNYRISVAIVVKATVPLSARDIVVYNHCIYIFFNKIKIFKHYIKAAEVTQHDEGNTSWANIASMKDFNDDSYTVVSYQRKRRPSALEGNSGRSTDSGATSHARRLIGKKVNIDASDQSALVAVQRRVMAFVGRLHKDTTEDQLQSWLVTAGLQEVKCKKLSPKNGKEFNTAAFFASSAAASKDLFYNEQTWPAGCELRDWYIKTKHSSSE